MVGCSPGGSYDYNVWYLAGAGTCGPHDVATANDPFTSDDVMPDEITLGEFTPKTAAKPIDFTPVSFCSANPGICPSSDFWSVNRPQGTAYDAGAYELSTGGGGGNGPSIGDLNSDGHVNITDLSILLSHYGQSGASSQGDCNSDGTINITDLSILLSYYGL